MIDDVASWHDGYALTSMVSNKLPPLVALPPPPARVWIPFPGVYCSTVGLRHDDLLLFVYRASCELVRGVPCLQGLQCQNRHCQKDLDPVVGYRPSLPIYCVYCYNALLKTVGILLLPTLVVIPVCSGRLCPSQSATCKDS